MKKLAVSQAARFLVIKPYTRSVYNSAHTVGYIELNPARKAYYYLNGRGILLNQASVPAILHSNTSTHIYYLDYLL